MSRAGGRCAIQEALSLVEHLHAIGAGLGPPLLAVIPTEVGGDRFLHGVALVKAGFQLLGGGVDGLHRIIGVDAHSLGRGWDVLHQALGAAVLGGLPHGGGVETRLLLRQRHQHVDGDAILAGGGIKVGLERHLARGKGRLLLRRCLLEGLGQAEGRGVRQRRLKGRWE